ncbi:EAL domain-containing protein [Agrobacterium rhizogenes]|nr:EAL domain-containing protein [Rhizobium rhizogenes]NTF79144.1 EAL domain-containing protein [Rhizobium rhizogenes]NTG18400.1 EAL domain-containing protein [Rhizobium rhizogenes]NTH55536.1 EAL domain-containing protein [Rhizobium rhizogenes]NTH75119.1 EAL domain-containing protein [Rhizobium rhizogenes]
MSIPLDNPELLKAQYRAFSYQLPLMYVILLTNTWVLASTHMSVAPTWLVLYIPVLLTLVCVVRIVSWSRSMRIAPTSELAAQALTRTNRLASIIAIAFTAWALTLFPYGDAYAKSHVAFYMAITVIGVIFCLMHLRPAAFTVAIIVNGAFFIFFVLSGNAVFVATAINTALVSGTMLVILLVYYRDFTRMVEAQVRTEALSNENFRLANLDSLTALPNRRAFFSHLAEAFAEAQANGHRLAVGIVDLDGFKPVNDLYGHGIGDKLLYEVGQRLAGLCPQNVHLARLGGDEFALIVSKLSYDTELLALGDRLCLGLRQPFLLAEAAVQISGSIGFAVYPEMAANVENLFERADYALYHGKRTSRGNAVLFSSDHDAEIRRDARIEQALQMADLHEELSVVFQPIVDVRSHETIGFEALARWTSPIIGKVSPAQFIPVAERAGFINRVTRPLLEKALAAAVKWPAGIRLSFNLSAQDLTSPECLLHLISIIHGSCFDPKRLDLEITETAFTADFGQIQTAITTLKALGCGISLDDFGTGYSSLSRLHSLPLTKIKIDRSFVANLHEKPASYKIVKSLLALGRDMGLDCIIEGVETSEEMAALKELGGLIVQGYFYSPPIPEADIRDFLKVPISRTEA